MGPNLEFDTTCKVIIVELDINLVHYLNHLNTSKPLSRPKQSIPTDTKPLEVWPL